MANPLMLCRKVITVCIKNHKENKHT
jgi:hypothetical protein